MSDVPTYADCMVIYEDGKQHKATCRTSSLMTVAEAIDALRDERVAYVRPADVAELRDRWQPRRGL